MLRGTISKKKKKKVSFSQCTSNYIKITPENISFRHSQYQIQTFSPGAISTALVQREQTISKKKWVFVNVQGTTLKLLQKIFHFVIPSAKFRHFLWVRFLQLWGSGEGEGIMEFWREEYCISRPLISINHKYSTGNISMLWVECSSLATPWIHHCDHLLQISC